MEHAQQPSGFRRVLLTTDAGPRKSEVPGGLRVNVDAHGRTGGLVVDARTWIAESGTGRTTVRYVVESGLSGLAARAATSGIDVVQRRTALGPLPGARLCTTIGARGGSAPMAEHLPWGADDSALEVPHRDPAMYNARGHLKASVYDDEIARLQEQLVLLQYWIQSQGLKVLVIFEGRGSAGKGGVIKRITERTSPRTVRVVALPRPTERQRTQWYFQRYVEHLPAAGEMVLFDRSWYNRSNVEWVMGFCTEDEHAEFLRSCPEFERMLVRSGIVVLKYWFSVSYDEQRRRFEARNAEPLKRWKLSEMDLAEHELYVRYSMAKDTTFQYTDIKQAPWYVVPSDDKRAARLNCISHLLSQFDYEDVAPDLVELPVMRDYPYVRPPRQEQTFVPARF